MIDAILEDTDVQFLVPAEQAWFAGRLVDAYCAGDSLVRAMLFAPIGQAVSS